MIAVTVLTADFGGFPAGMRAHPLVVEKAAKFLRAEHGKRIVDSFVTRAGGRIACVIASADRDGTAAVIDELLAACRSVAEGLGFSGNGGAETVSLSFEERADEAVLVFLSAGADPQVWGPPLCRLFADPFATPSLAGTHGEYAFTFDDGAAVETPSGIFALIERIEQGCIPVGVERRDGLPAAAAGRGPDPALIVRAGGELPAVNEALDAAAAGALMPVSLCDMTPVAAKTACLGFSVRSGMLIGPADLYDDPVFRP